VIKPHHVRLERVVRKADQPLAGEFELVERREVPPGKRSI
jgi:hypothetical protein